MKLRWKPRGRGSILSRLTPWMEVPTLIAWFPLDPSSPSSSMFLRNNHWLDFMLRCLARKPHDGPLAPGDGLQSGKKIQLLTPKKCSFIFNMCFFFSTEYPTANSKGMTFFRSSNRGRRLRLVRKRHHDRSLRGPRSQRLHAWPFNWWVLKLAVSSPSSFFRRVCPHRPWDDV